jgi:hypothetical protein
MDVALPYAAHEVLLHVFVDDVEIHGDLRDQNAIRIRTQTAPEGGVSGVTTEHLDDHDPVVAHPCGLQLFHEAGDAVDG